MIINLAFVKLHQKYGVEICYVKQIAKEKS